MPLPAPFRHCPACGAERLVYSEGKRIDCDACGLSYFHNVAVAVAAVVRAGDEVLLTRRAHEPAAGLLDFPGGFVDPGESFEAALIRELDEELGLKIEPEQVHYIGSIPNTYPYAGVVYHTSDAYFGIELGERPSLQVGDDVSDALWTRLGEIDPAALAFDSVRRALDLLTQAEAAA